MDSNLGRQLLSGRPPTNAFHTGPELALTAGVEVVIIGLAALGAWTFHASVPGAEVFLVLLVFAGLMVALTLAVLKVLRTVWPMREGSYDWRQDRVVFNAWKMHQFLCMNNLFLVYIIGFLPLPIRKFFHRLLGAHIGRGIVSIGGLIADPYLVTIEEGAMIGHDTLLMPCRLTPDELMLGRITVRHGAVVGARSVVMPGVTIGEGSMVKAMSMVAENTTIPPYEVWAGNPARRVSEAPRPASDEEPPRFMGWRDLLISPAIQTALLVSTGGGAWALCRIEGWGVFEGALLFYGLLITFTLIVLKLLRTLFPFSYGTFTFREHPGVCYLWNLNGFLCIINLFIQYTNNVTPPLLRKWFSGLLGARIARGSGLSIAGLILDPFAVTVEEGAVVGHEALILPHAVSVDALMLRPILLKQGSVVGPRSVVMPGVTLGRNARVEPMSLVTAGTQIPDDEVWGGVPARRLGTRAPAVEDSSVFGTRPAEVWLTWMLSLVLLTGSFAGASFLKSAWGLHLFGWLMAAYTLLVLESFVMLWVFRRFWPVPDGLYDPRADSSVFLRWKMSNFIALTSLSLFYQYAVLPASLRKLVMRLLGARLSLQPPWSLEGHLFDPSRIVVSPGALLLQDSMVLPVDFRDGKMVLKGVRLGRDAVVGARAFLMPGVELGDGARVEAMSLVSEDTKIPAGEVWGGNPARKLSGLP